MARPFLIGIGGTYSGTGKTVLAAEILRFLTSRAEHNKWGALKYTKTSSPAQIISERTKLLQKGKDTWHMLMAGASDVQWVRSSREGLTDALRNAIKKYHGLDGVVLEGNSAIEFSKPDIVIFIFGKDRSNWKKNIGNILAITDILLYEDRSVIPSLPVSAKAFPRDFSEQDVRRRFFAYLTALIYERKTEKRDDRKGH